MVHEPQLVSLETLVLTTDSINNGQHMLDITHGFLTNCSCLFRLPAKTLKHLVLVDGLLLIQLEKEQDIKCFFVSS